MTEYEILKILIKIHKKYSYERYSNESSRMCTIWSTDDPPDVLEETIELNEINDCLKIDIDEDFAIELYDMTIKEASKCLYKYLKFLNEKKMDDINFEEWEVFADFFDAENWGGLLKYLEDKLLKNPSDIYTQLQYADALNRNQKYQETIDFLTPLYDMYKDETFGIYEIIEALYGLGKTIDDFKWIKKPLVLELDENTLRLSKQFFYRKRKYFSIFDIYEFLILKSDYIIYKEEELLQFLKQFPNVFKFIEDDEICNVKIQLNRNNTLDST